MLLLKNRKEASPDSLRSIPEKELEPSPNSYAGHPPFNCSIAFDPSGFVGCCCAIVDSAFKHNFPSIPNVKNVAEAVRMPRSTSAALRLLRITRFVCIRGTLTVFPCKSFVSMASPQKSAVFLKLVRSISSKSQPDRLKTSSNTHAGLLVNSVLTKALSWANWSSFKPSTNTLTWGKALPSLIRFGTTRDI